MSRTNGDATEAAQSAPSQEPIRGLGPNLKPLRILIAEDNEFNAQHLERLLVRGHHSVRLANNGREALALLGIDAQKSGADSLIPPGPSPPASPPRPVPAPLISTSSSLTYTCRSWMGSRSCRRSGSASR